MSVLRRILEWVEDRTGLAALIKPMATHLVPPGSKWWYVFGSATLAAFAVQAVTGIALATVYSPTAGQAYASLKFISEVAPFGRLVRGMHYFGASAMVLLAVVHLTRVFLMGAYKYPREANWLSGVVLLGLTLLMGITGQVLRWDQNAVWTTVVGAAQAARTPLLGPWLVRLILGGDTVGNGTLGHFFVLHVFLVPGALIAIVTLHLYLVLRNGISEPPVAGQPVEPAKYRAWYHAMLERTGVPFWPCAAWRDALFGVLVIVAIVLLAVAVGAPALDRPPDPSIIEAQPKPDWFLLWYFAILAYLPHAAEDYVILLAPPLLGGLLLAVPFVSNRGERSWRRRPWAPVLVIFTGTCLGVLCFEGDRERWTPDFAAKPLPDSVVGLASAPVAEGAAAFDRKGGLYCHAVSGYGGTRGPDLTDGGDRLSRDQLVIRVLNGGYNMPGYANNLTPAQLDAVIAFMLSRRTH